MVRCHLTHRYRTSSVLISVQQSLAHSIKPDVSQVRHGGLSNVVFESQLQCARTHAQLLANIGQRQWLGDIAVQEILGTPHSTQQQRPAAAHFEC